MVKVIIISVSLIICSFGYGQSIRSSANQGRGYGQSPDFGRAGLLEVAATVSPSTMFARKSVNAYLSAFAEYHFDYRVSLRSDNYFHLKSLGDSPFVNNAIRSYFGVFYHFNRGVFRRWDAYVGFQPGITVMSKNNYGNQPIVAIAPSRTIISPSFALMTGAKLYVLQNVNLFANMSYLNSKLRGTPDGPLDTGELIFTMGVGFQIRIWRDFYYMPPQKIPCILGRWL